MNRKEMKEIQEENEQRIHRVKTLGKKIGQTAGGEIFVLDGIVWTTGLNGAINKGEYIEVCQKYREGKYNTNCFKIFHLENN